jgi:electron transfer flavoprotein alpha subunit
VKHRSDERPLRIAALAKQIPEFEKMEMHADGRLVRVGVPLEMSAYDRRAVAQGVALAAASGGRCTVITLGPESAEDILLESIAFGADDAVLVTDPVFAGSDTLATARALAEVLRRRGPFDLVLAGRNSVDAETGQVGPQVAELLDLPFATAVKRLEVDPDGRTVQVACELDDEWVELTVTMPAVLSTAERLIDPVKIKDPAAWVGVDRGRVERMDARSLGPGPWGQAGSETWVGEVQVEPTTRRRQTLAGPVADQVEIVVRALADAGLLGGPGEAGPAASGAPVPSACAVTAGQPVVGVLVEPGRQRIARELFGAAAELAHELEGRVVAIGPWLLTPEPVSSAVTTVLASWGADELIVLEPTSSDPTAAVPLAEEDVASAVAAWAARTEPAVVLAPGTAWGREVAGRVAARLGAGLTGDATAMELEAGRLVAWKPAFGGAMLAAVRSRSISQLVTVRAGVLPAPVPRVGPAIPPTIVRVQPRGRVRVRARRRDDDLEVLAAASRVLAVGRGVAPADYPQLEGLRRRLGAELAATRKVTDEGWLPHSRQVGITGLSLAPELAVVIGASGKFNHMVGFRRAGLIVAVNPDPAAPVFEFADYGVVGDWREVVPELERRLAGTRQGTSG